ncbi:hypothetical protein ES705_36972 [subsurface metagenome]
MFDILKVLIGIFVGFFLNEIHRIFIEKRESEKILKIIEEELRVSLENIKEQHSTLSIQGEGLLNKKSASLFIDAGKLKKLTKIYQKFQMINKGLERHVILDASGMPSKNDLKNKISEWRDECSDDIKEYLNTSK